jgi:uncharacterized cofD-like protein
MRIKRYLALLILGIAFMALGIAYVLTQVYRTQPFPEYVGALTLQFIDRPIRGVLFFIAGTVVAGIGLVKLNRALLDPFLANPSANLIQALVQNQNRQRGPRIVAIGGGTGLSTLLRGLKGYTHNLTAVVSVADDGGSSGMLRQDLGVLPPGDLRQCLLALADVEPLMTKLFSYRFESGSLSGHSFGNLFLVAMMGVNGNLERALEESSRVLAVRGRILPTTLDSITLCAEFDDGTTVEGESNITHAGKRIRRLFSEPATPAAHPEAISALLDAEMIVIGPGSLYTSVMPNLLVYDIVRAIRGSSAVKVYVCNVATEHGETDEYSLADHVRVLDETFGPGLFRYVLANGNASIVPLPGSGARAVPADPSGIDRKRFEPVFADLVSFEDPVRHDSRKLAKALISLYSSRRRQNGQRDAEEIEYSEREQALT